MLTRESLQFLEDLKANNNRDWFWIKKKNDTKLLRQIIKRFVADFTEHSKTIRPKSRTA
jgi:uncharacterized protein (DUF2461 family)